MSVSTCVHLCPSEVVCIHCSIAMCSTVAECNLLQLPTGFIKKKKKWRVSLELKTGGHSLISLLKHTCQWRVRHYTHFHTPHTCSPKHTNPIGCCIVEIIITKESTGFIKGFCFVFIVMLTALVLIVNTEQPVASIFLWCVWICQILWKLLCFQNALFRRDNNTESGYSI